ncbi:MAG: transglycosylase SLT domain-containing protein [Pseudomonadota bacterium]
MPRTTRLSLLAIVLLASGSAVSIAATGIDELADSRAVFRAAYAAAEHGQWSPTGREEALLKSYVLWPDLRGKYLEKTLATAAATDIDSFLDRYDGTAAARALRYRWARHLAAQERWADYLAIYEHRYAALNNTALDCLALTATVALDRTVDGTKAIAIWRHGRSRPEECDPLFAWMDTAGLLNATERAARFDLAIAERNFTMARWLARSLDAGYRDEARLWLALQTDPAATLTTLRGRPDDAALRAKLRYGIGRLGRVDTLYADELWQALAAEYTFTAAERASVAEELALIAAWRHEPFAARLIAAVDTDHRSVELIEWEARTALRDGDWQTVLSAISRLPEEVAERDGWRYWRAIALERRGSPEAAARQLDALAGERSYYGFLAADRRDKSYDFGHDAVRADTAIQAKLDRRPGIVRARELFLAGLSARGRSEWDRALAALSDAEKKQAALLAAGWGWHSRAIATVAVAGHYDDLELRYPLPYRQWFDAYSRAADIAPTWALGVARSESLFMPDVRSPAGALGLMQLLPSTGRAAAKQAGESFDGPATLTDPRANIVLGTHYLGDMLRRFDRHQALATAAYNAGPHRVDRWVADVAGMPAEVWIETIPFDETRRYVQRVLEAETVFYWRLNDRVRRVSQVLPPVAGPERRAATGAADRPPGGG